MSVQEAPDRRAWSTKWPIEVVGGLAEVRRPTITASATWSSGSAVSLLDARRSGRRAEELPVIRTGSGHAVKL